MKPFKNNRFVKLAVRIRPLLKNEENGVLKVIHEQQPVIILNENKTFEFDYVFDENSNQECVFDILVRPLILKVIDGSNATVVAYGQSGTGKSYTLGCGDKISMIDNGLIFHTLKGLFKFHENNPEIMISISFVEIYCKKIYDLLTNNDKERQVKGFKLDAYKKNAANFDEALQFLSIGAKKRHKGSTKLNLKSSRSHAIFTIYVKNKNRNAQFQLIDLAGVERTKRSECYGNSLDEGININKSLFYFAELMRALVSGASVPPFRDDVFTRLLQDFIYDNTLSFILLTCISSAKDDYNETLNALKFAKSCKNIKHMYKTPNHKMLNIIQKKSVLQNSNISDANISTSTTIEGPSFSPLAKHWAEEICNLNTTCPQTVEKTISRMLTEFKDKNLTKRTLNFDETMELIPKDDSLLMTNPPVRRSMRISLKHSVDDYNNSKIKFPKNNSPVIINIPTTNGKRLSANHQMKDYVSPNIKVLKDSPFRNFSVRRSIRLKRSTDIYSPDLHVPVRRSKRLSIKPNITICKTPVPAPRSLPAEEFKVPVGFAPKTLRVQPTPQPRKFLKETYAEHRKRILDILNCGTQKELQHLPTVGLKTAVQIITYRNLNGLFDDVNDLENMPGWRGNSYERFLRANYCL